MGLVENTKQRLGEWLTRRAFLTKSWDKLWASVMENKLFQNTVTSPYEQSSTVFMAIRAIADNAQNVKLKFYKKSDEETEVTPEPIVRLFDNPNPLMGFSELLEATVIFQQLTGESFWRFMASRGQLAGTSSLPAEIWPYSPSMFSEIIEGDSLTGWWFNSRAGRERLTLEEVLHVREFNPNGSVRGLSRLKAAQNAIDIDWKALIYSKAFFDNDATPGMMLSTDKDLNAETVERLRQWIEKRHKGASNAFKVAVLEGGLKPVTIGADQQKMQFIEQRKYYREELLGIFRVPKAMFSITEDLNYATFIGQKRVFWTDTMMPLLSRIENELNSQFFSRYAPEYICRFDYSNVMDLQEDIKDKVAVAQQLVSMGWPLNMVNKRLGLGMDDVAWGDVAWMPFSNMPVSGPEDTSRPAADPAPEPDADEDDDEEGKSQDIRANKLMMTFNVRQTRIETQMTGKISKYWIEQRARVLKTLETEDAKGIKSTPMEWSKEEDYFIRLMTPFQKEGIRQGAAMAKEFLGAAINQEILDGKLTSYLTARLMNNRLIVRRMGAVIGNMIAESVASGESVTVLADKIKQQYNVAAKRSMTIARTESTGAINGGSLEYYKEAGVKGKVWQTSNDENVRGTHRALNGVRADINKRFLNGVDFPGGDGPAEEVINCRCSYLPTME